MIIKKNYKYIVYIIFFVVYVMNIWILITTEYTFSTNTFIQDSCEYKVIPFGSGFILENKEYIPIYSSSLEIKDLKCIGKIYNLQNNNYIYENIFVFNFIKLIYFLSSLLFFANRKIKFKKILFFNSLFYIIYYFNFSFDFLYQTNLKFFSYELIFFEILLLSSLSHFKIEFFKNKNLPRKYLSFMFKKIEKYFFILLLIYLTRVVYLYFNFEEIRLGILSEWLINYNYGFIKRGLAGEAIQIITDFSGVSQNTIMLYTLVIIHSIFLTLLKPYILKLTDYRNLLIVLSPLFFLYNLNLVSTILLPKELLGMIALLLIKKYKNTNFEFLGYLFLIFSIFSHEINFIFLIPILYAEKNRKKILFIVLVSTILFFFIFSTETGIERIEQLCEDNVYLQETNCYKSVAMNNSLNYQKNYASQIVDIDYLLIYLIYLLLGITPLILNRWLYKNFLYVVSVFFPLFLLSYFTVDWGRWLFIFCTIIYLNFLDEVKINSEINLPMNSYFLIILFNLLWKVPHWGVNENYYSTILRIDKFSFVVILFLLFNFQKWLKLLIKN